MRCVGWLLPIVFPLIWTVLVAIVYDAYLATLVARG